MLGFFRHLWFLKRLGVVSLIGFVGVELSYGGGSVRLLETPLAFEPNEGQFPAGRVFGARYKGYEIALDDAGLEIDPGGFHGSHLAIRLSCQPGHGEKPILTGRDRLPGVSHYFIGKEPWFTGIAQFRRVHYAGLCSGIDMQVYGTSEGIEYDLIIAPGVEPQRVSILFEGAEGLRLDERGNLLVKVLGRTWRQPAPTIYQEMQGKRFPVEGGYVVTDDGAIRFWVSEYDQSNPLIIDPVLVFSTLLGQSSATAVATDSSGNIYVTGSDRLDGDVVISKLDPKGTSVIYSARLGGSSGDQPNGIAVDRQANVYVVGTTSSSDFPTRDAIQPNRSGGNDAFVLKLGADGSTLIYSTYLGGSAIEEGIGVAVDLVGNAYVAGTTHSANFPTKDPVQAAKSEGSDAFVAKVNTSGSEVIFSTFLGGSGADTASAVAIDDVGAVYLTGGTTSTDFPTTVGSLQQMFKGGFRDAFVTKFDSSGKSLAFSSYLGGSGNEQGNGIAVHLESGDVYVVGSTDSSDFLAGSSPSLHSKGGRWDAFIARIDAGGSSLVYFTFLGGNEDDGGGAVAVDPAGRAVVIGETRSSNFPLVNPIQDQFGGGRCRFGGIITFELPCADIFVAKLNETGSNLIYSSYLGGNREEDSGGIALDSPRKAAYLVGTTNSSDFPVTHRLGASTGGAFVAKIMEGSRLLFAQFGDGEQSRASIASQIILANLDADKPAEVEIALNDSNGNPMVVDLNGQLVAGTTTLTIAPSGVVALTTDGRGKLQVGSAVVTADRKISGVILFRASVGLAGVGASRASNRLSIPVLTDGELSSGVAIMNVGGAQTINLTLRNADGNIVARALIHLPEKGQLARFVTEVDWDVALDFSNFSGILVIEGSSQLAATAILVSRNRYATLPVIEH